MMGFCQRCGDITSGKCSKCGGRSVQSTIGCLVSDDGVSIVDRWQSQYAGTILSPEAIVLKSTTAKRIVVTQSTFYDPIKKLCTCCSQVLDQKYTKIEGANYYCQECHQKLFNRGECPTCHRPVSDKQRFVEYSKKVWHAECFVCVYCHKELEANPLVDLQNQPCCEPCFMSQAGKGRPARAPSPKKFDSYSSQSSLSSTDSSYSRSRGLSSPSSPILSRTPSPKQHLKEEDSSYVANSQPKRASVSPHQHSLTSMFIPPTSSKSSSINASPNIPYRVSPSVSTDVNTPSIPQGKSIRSLSQRPCHYCHQPLGDATQKKIKIAIGPQQYAWFHKSCFLCSKCHMPFKDGECTTDGQSFYHSHCDRYCHGCEKPIKSDSFKFNNRAYHFDCFRCHANGCKINLGDPVFEVNGKPFCHSCHAFTMIPTTAQKEPLVSNRPKRVLPKLGGSKCCPRCKESISIMDDTPGPLASRWHKKCLRCAKCQKQLDSAAKMRQNEEGSSLVYCRNCIA